MENVKTEEEIELSSEALGEMREFNIKTDSLTAFSIELLYTDLIEEIEEEEPKLVGHYALFGAAESITRAAKMLLKAAPNNPELANAIVNIANTISVIGEKLTVEYEETNKEIKRENTLLNSEEIDTLMKTIMGINVDLPEQLK